VEELSENSIVEHEGCQKKSSVLMRYLANRESQDSVKEGKGNGNMKWKEEVVQNMEVSVVLQYFGVSEYLVKNYSYLIDECSLIFLKNIQPEPAQTAKSLKVIMTDLKT
jgi:hypothetical protein